MTAIYCYCFSFLTFAKNKQTNKQNKRVLFSHVPGRAFLFGLNLISHDKGNTSLDVSFVTLTMIFFPKA